MPVDPDSVTSLSDFSVNKSAASVILYRAQTGTVKIRKASEWRKANLEKYLKEKKLVSDPRNDVESLDYLIIYYGKEDLAKSLVGSLKDSEIESFSVDTTTASRASDSTKRSTRGSENQVPNTSQDIVKILSVMRDEQSEIRQLLNKFEMENIGLKNKVDELLERGHTKKSRVTLSEAGELIQYCTAEVAKRRLDVKKFEDKLDQIPWDRVNVNKNQKKNILDELRFGRRIPKMISVIGEIIYGETLLTHILGRNGKRERSRRETERAHVISLEQEQRLRDILGVFDDLFTSDKAWKAIVQHHINQKGRDAKKANKRFNDETSDATSDDSDEKTTPRKKRKRVHDKVSPNDSSGSRVQTSAKTNGDETQKTGEDSSEQEHENPDNNLS